MARLRITFRGDPAPDPVELSLGAFSQIAAKRRYGLEAMKTEDPEPLLFGVWVELVGPQSAKASGDDGFDSWLFGVEGFELVDKDAPELDEEADPPTPAETSSEVSPDSPPTSASIPEE